MKQLLCALICISVLNFSCKKDQEKPIKPVAEFIIVGQDFTAPCVVTFENISKNSSYYIWDFGNGGGAFIPTPEITKPIASYYPEGGTYTITLTTGGQGFNSVFTKQIVIKPSIEEQMPFAFFSYFNKTFYINEPIPLMNSSLRAKSYEWFFSDGTYSTEKNPIKTFKSKGDYGIMLVASNEFGSDTVVQGITIQPTVFKRAMISSITIDEMPFENAL